MKKVIFSLLSAVAITSSVFAADNNTVWHSADTLPLLGKGIDPASTVMRYQRLPDSMKTKVKRDAVYYLGTNSAGMAIRFASDAPAIDIKWKSLYKNLMNHQTPTGTRGLDLYTLLPDSTWTFVNSARPDVNNHFTSANVISNMDPVMREYLLYLPLYDGIDSLYIGTGRDYVVTAPKVDVLIPGSAATPKPIVMYGTSLLQGGCANRPGMAHSNIITRRLNRPVLNFGFSGNGQLDLEIAEILAAIPDPAMYVLDFVPNVNEQQIEEQMIPFVEIIEKAHPGVPILFPE
ncbi:MAG: SGNH/GDSL hydrolase family protein, partial [Muribaculaceae bacterium]|nr:SGNH/GDSL hydrolase family protein [Muribaculaceae bacterium]